MIGRNGIENYLNKIGQWMEISITGAVSVIGKRTGITVFSCKRKTLLYNEDYIYYWNIHIICQNICQKWRICQERDVQQYLYSGISK